MKIALQLLSSASFFFLTLLLSTFNQYVSAYSLDHSYSKSPVLNDPNLALELVAKGIKFPTSMAFLDKDDILVLEKNDGTVKRILNGTVLEKPLLDVNVANQVEEGMLGIAVSKNLPHNKTYVFLYYTEAEESEPREGGEEEKEAVQGVVIDEDDDSNEGGEQGSISISGDGGEPIGNRLYRYEYIDNRIKNPKLLLDLPVGPGYYHNGGIVALGPDGSVYVAIGDVAYYDYFESYPPLDGRGGILRIATDDNIIKNNDSLDSAKSDNLYYAYGIRNSFGIDFDPVTGNLWDTENGPGYGDEINLVKEGFNSGWPVIQGIWKVESYFDGKIPVLNPDEVLVNIGNYNPPEFIWKIPIGVTAIKFLDSPIYGKQYQNDAIIGNFNEGNIYHFDLNEDRTRLSLGGQLGDRIANKAQELQQVLFGQGFGGTTDIEVSPDGYLYVLTINKGGHNCNESNNNTCLKYSSGEEGAIFRITPKKNVH
jgi:glucose/arabinose dehydrogenase